MSKQDKPIKGSAVGVTVDLMRGLLAVMVLVAHALESATFLKYGDSTAGPRVLSATLGYGGFWVGGFFVLSGFCVHRAIMGMRMRDSEFLRPYLLARSTRLYPIYLVALAMAAASWMVKGPFIPAESVDAGWKMLQHLAMLQGVTGAFHELKPAWSLTYEMAYYLAWPALLLFFGWSVKRALLAGAVSAVALAAVLLLIWKGTFNGASDSLLIPLGLIPAQFVLWLGGASLAQYWDSAQCLVNRWLGGAALAGVLVVYALQAVLVHDSAPQWTLLLAGYAALPCWLALILGSCAWQGLVRWEKCACWLGLLSYPLYIMHQVLLDAAVGMARAHGMTDVPVGMAALALALVVMVVMITVGVPLEAALLRWRACWLSRQRNLSMRCALANR